MASRNAAADSSPSHDPIVSTFMRDIGRVPLLDHRQEQQCGMLIERQRYLEEITEKARWPKAPNLTIGVLRRINRQKALIDALANVAGLPPDPTLSQLTNDREFRDLVDLKQHDDAVRKVKQRTKAGSALRNEADLKRRMVQVSRDTFILTPRMIRAAGDCPISELDNALRTEPIFELLKADREPLGQELANFAEDSKSAQNKLTESNMRLVMSIAGNFSNNNVPLMDLAQEGAFGLMDASQRYDHRLGLKFSTYATHWIRHRITKALAKQSRAIRIPENKHKLAREIYYARTHLAQDLGRQPTNEETAVRLNISLELLNHIDQIDQNPDSLDELLFEDDTETRAERVAADLPGPDEVAIGRMLKPDINRALDFLPRKERTVIKMRYGLNNDTKCTVSEIARTIGADRDQVREMEKNAITKLQSNPKVIAMLREYL